MIQYEPVIIPQKTVQSETRRICDGCGRISPNKENWAEEDDIDAQQDARVEVTTTLSVKRRVNYRYTGEGYVSESAYHLCPICMRKVFGSIKDMIKAEPTTYRSEW